MRRICFILLVLPSLCFSQNLDEKIQGSWICEAILDSMGRKAGGEFGTSVNYLRFQFQEKKLFLALAPFDRGSQSRISYSPDYFDILNTSLTQTRYKIIQIDEEKLVLETTHKRRKLLYHFVNESLYARELDQLSNVRDYEKLILEASYLKNVQGYYLSSYYLISNSILNLIPSPQFVDKQYFSLGAYLEANLRLTLTHLIELNGKDTIIEFEVGPQGIENVLIAKKLGDEIDFQLYDLISGMSKMWQPLTVNGKVTYTRIRLKIEFRFVER